MTASSAELRADPRIEFIDNVRQQQAGLQRLRPASAPDVTAEPIAGPTTHGAERWSAFWARAHFGRCDWTATET